MAQFTGLASSPIIAFVPVMNVAGAREFYEKTLGLRLIEDELPYALVFDVNGIMLRVTPVRFHVPAQQTILGWHVPDIAAAVSALTGTEFRCSATTFPRTNRESGPRRTA